METKAAISLDTAKGIAALHSCGIVHGDIKTENVLMVESTRWVAKVADFSHSMLDTGDPAKLLGGTPPFNAPEWERKLSSAGLYKTDVFSFGLVLGCVFVGTDIFEKFTESKRHGLTLEACKKNFEEVKTNENLREYVTDLLYEIDDTDLSSPREDISFTRALLDLSLHEEPNERDLGQIISKLSRTREEHPAAPPETIISRLDTNIIAIPYQALNNTSHLQGARHLLVKTTDMRDKLCPKTVDDLHSLLITSSNMLDAHEEIAALWSEMYEVFRVLPSLPRDRKIQRRYHHSHYDKQEQVHETYNRGLVYVSAQKRNASALECFLRLGFSVNGTLWNRLTLTPYDTVRGGTSVSGDGDEDQAQCVKMLQDRGAHRGLFYLVEFQILLTVVTNYLLFCLMMKDIPFFLWMMSIFPEIPGTVKEMWGEGMQGSGMPVWVFAPLFLLILFGVCGFILAMSVVSLIPLVTPALYTFTTLLSLGRTVPKWFLEHDKCPWWVSKKSNTAIILHFLPSIWLGALVMNDVEYEAVQTYIYGPTVMLIRSLHERNSRKRLVAVPRQPRTEATEASNDAAVEHLESTSRQDRFPGQSFKQGLDIFINRTTHSMSSLPSAVAALIHRLANRRSLRGYGRSRPFCHDAYRDDDDDDAELRSLLRSEEFDYDDAHELA